MTNDIMTDEISRSHNHCINHQTISKNNNKWAMIGWSSVGFSIITIIISVWLFDLSLSKSGEGVQILRKFAMSLLGISSGLSMLVLILILINAHKNNAITLAALASGFFAVILTISLFIGIYYYNTQLN